MDKLDRVPFSVLLVTGGCEFIQSNFIDYVLEQLPSSKVVNFDRSISADNNVSSRVASERGDTGNYQQVDRVLQHYNVDAVVHFVAETRIYESYKDPQEIVRSNIQGTVTLLEACRKYGRLKRFVYINTNEVYGDRESEKAKTELDALQPTNPYAAATASAEHFVRVYQTAYNFPTITVRMCNAYGPGQNPARVVPKFIHQAANGEPFTIHGDGNQLRCFMHVSDICAAMLVVLMKGGIGEVYNLSTAREISVINLATEIKNVVDDVMERETGTPFEVRFVDITKDRPYNDQRYYTDASKMRDLGWEEKIPFRKGLKETVSWYQRNEEQIQNSFKDKDKANLEAMQQEGTSKVATQGEVARVHQFLKEVRTKEEELKKMREEHEAELSRLKSERTKQQETEFELKAQIRAKDEKINILQSQMDALQCDKDNLQQQLNAKGAALCMLQQQAAEYVERPSRATARKRKLLEESEQGMLKKRHFIDAHVRGTEVIAQKTFTLTQDALDLSFEGYGFKLHVPEGSLPEEVSKTQLNVRVSLSGQFQLPSDCELVSAVYLVSSSNKLMKSVTVEIQHCAALSNDKQCSQLTFIHGECTQEELPYKFKEQEGGVFSLNSSYGSVSVPNFSWIAIVRRLVQILRGFQAIGSEQGQQAHNKQEGKGEQEQQQTELSESSLHIEEACQTDQEEEGEVVVQYCARLYTRKLQVNEWKVDFVVTRDLETCSSVVENEYISHAKPVLSFTCGFEKECISLEVPKDGLKVGGWRITPCYDPEIKKEDVNYFHSAGRTIPNCELLLHWDHDTPPTCFHHQIGLLGALNRSYFLLHVNPAITLSDSSSEVCTAQEEAPIGMETMSDIIGYLDSLNKQAVLDLGLVLGLDYKRLMTMRDSQSFLQDMLAGWLNRVDHVLGTGVPTWKRLVEALNDSRVGQNGVANEIEQDKLKQ